MIRTRMAPSPTGEYHIGHIRTLLYNYALAKKHGGKFILRIEDTDRERYVAGATERILEVIRDYGFSWDEGPQVGGEYAPYVQSERLEIYQKYANELIEKESAYRCFCTSERLSQMREEQKKKGVPSTKYDRHCLGLSVAQVEEKIRAGTPSVVRLKVPENKKIVFNDEVYGKVSFDSSEIDDQILMKSDGFPTYHFAVVVDDHLMKITHVMRGNDWISSTPKHVLLYEAFGWDQPTYIHLPNLKEIGSNKKLSKRFGPVSAREFLDNGYLPEALVNFIMLLGWNPGNDQEIFDLGQFVKEFDTKKIHKTDLVAFDRNKLEWMNGQYIQSMDSKKLAQRIFEFLDKKYELSQIEKITPLVNTRIKRLGEFEDIAGFFFNDPEYNTSLFGENYKEHLQAAASALEKLSEWTKENIDTALMDQVKSNDFHTGKFFMDLRIALSGKKVTPPMSESLVVLGKEKTISRLVMLLEK